MEAVIREFESDKQLVRTLFNNFGKVLVFIFWADWHQPAADFRRNFEATLPFFGSFPNVKYFALSHDRCPETFNKFNVEATPTVIFTQTDRTVLRRDESGDPGLILDALAEVSQAHQTRFEAEHLVWERKVAAILEGCPLIVFIKGTPQAPRCGFTESILKVFEEQKVDYAYYDILEDEQMRYWLRYCRGWPTYPQFFVSGKLQGGLDVLRELVAKGEFLSLVPPSSRTIAPEQRFRLLAKEHPHLVLTGAFPFEDKRTQKFLSLAKNQAKGEEVTFLNLSLDSKLQDWVKSSFGNLPILLSQGEVRNIPIDS